MAKNYILAMLSALTLCFFTQAKAENGQEWLQYCNPDTKDITAYGSPSEQMAISVATLFSKDFLAAHAGKSISAVAVYCAAPIKGTSVTMQKGNDINNMASASYKSVNYLFEGWNYIKFTTPVAIDGQQGISVELSASGDAGKALAYDGGAQVEGSSYKKVQYNDDVYKAADPSLGNMMVRLFIAEDCTPLGNQAHFKSMAINDYAAVGKPLTAKFILANATYTPTTDIEMSYTVNGVSFSKDIVFDRQVKANAQKVFEVELDGITADTDFSFNITKVNGVENTTCNAIGASVGAYTEQQAVERTLLVEKFTGQACGYCPLGSKSIDKAVAGYESRVARIDHHAGYEDDIFTIAESKDIVSLFNVEGAPTCMINRTLQYDRLGLADADGIVWSTSHMTPELIANELSRTAFVSININPQYDAASRKLKVNVSGKTSRSLGDLNMHLMITHDNYTAWQYNGSSGGDANYIHSHWPLVYLTPSTGERMTIAADGTFSIDYETVIAEKYNNDKITVDLNSLNALAFVADSGNKYNCKVHNAAFKALGNIDPTGITSTSTNSGMNIFADGGRIVCTAAAEICVLDAGGRRVANESLSPGLYIVKATAMGKEQIKKIIIR